MNHGKTVLAQVLDGLHSEHFRRCAQRWPMQRDTPALSAYDQFAAMVFAQLTYRESLRDIEACLGAIGPKRYHMDLGSAVARSTWPTPTRTAIGASLLTLRRWKRAKGCYPSGHSAKYLA